MARQDYQHIRFHYLKKDFTLRDRTRLKKFISQLLLEQGLGLEHVNYIFCSDPYLLKMNREYLNHDTYTDIITFQLSEPSAPALADIYISIDRVRDNAGGYGIPFNKELHRVIFHGALHLCGFKDKTANQARLMRTMEEQYLNRYFVPRGTKRR